MRNEEIYLFWKKNISEKIKKKEFLIKNKTFLIEDKTQFHILNQLWPIDIDDQEDLAVAELFLS